MRRVLGPFLGLALLLGAVVMTWLVESGRLPRAH